MKLYISESYLENKRIFKISDELGNLKYSVSIGYSLLRAKINVYNINSKKVAKIMKCDVCGFSIFYVFCNKLLCNENKIKVITNLVNFKELLYIYGINWLFRGSLLNKNFEIINVDKSLVMRHKKKEQPGKTVYEVNISEEKNELLCICIALCVEILNVKTVNNTMKAIGTAE